MDEEKGKTTKAQQAFALDSRTFWSSMRVTRYPLIRSETCVTQIGTRIRVAQGYREIGTARKGCTGTAVNECLGDD